MGARLSNVLRKLVLATEFEDRKRLFREYYDSGPPEEVEKMKKSGHLDIILQFLNLLSIPNLETEKHYYSHLENMIKSSVERIAKFATHPDNL